MIKPNKKSAADIHSFLQCFFYVKNSLSNFTPYVIRIFLMLFISLCTDFYRNITFSHTVILDMKRYYKQVTANHSITLNLGYIA